MTIASKKLTDKDNNIKNKTAFIYCLIASAIMIFVGHGYFFLSNALSFDTLQVIGQSDVDWKLALGRFTQPLYKNFIRGNISAPWLIGIMATIFLALAIFLIIKMFKITSKTSILVMAGIIGVNIAMIMTIGLYTHEFDIFMLAFLLQVVAVYIWYTIPKTTKYMPMLLIGSVCICLSLGLYQAYIATGASLVLMCLLYSCLNNETKIKTLLTQVLKALAMFVLGCILYYLMVKISVSIYGVTLSTDYNSLSNLFNFGDSNIISVIIEAYARCFSFLFTSFSYYSKPLVIISNWLILFISIICIFYLTRKNTTFLVISFIILFLFPLAMNCIYIFNPAAFYYQMTHSFFLYYVLAIVLVSTARKQYVINGFKFANILTIVLVSVILFNNIRFANQAYFKKDLEAKAFQSYMTEVFTRMDSVEGYVPGETPVLFISSPSMAKLGYEFNTNFDMFYLSSNSFYSTQWRFQWYIDFYMQRPIKLYNTYATPEDIDRLINLPEVQSMSVFPKSDSMRIIEYVLIVNLSDNSWYNN